MLSKYPRFWASVRENTSAADLPSIDAERAKFRRLYPEMRPASAYVVVGCMNSGGSTRGDKVLIGIEIAAGDENVDLSDLPPSFRQRLSTYFATQPHQKLALLMVHEYVHTRQREANGDVTLLGQTPYEGGADFVAERITGKVPDLPDMNYGPAHAPAIRRAFAEDMDETSCGGWLYNDTDNAFGVSDLGDYAVCAAYYERAADKREAIRDIIRLDTRTARRARFSTPRACACAERRRGTPGACGACRGIGAS